MHWKFFCILLLKFLSSDALGPNHGKVERFRRGASVYRMYIPSNGGHNPYLLNNNDPAPFLQYLGGGGRQGSKGSGGTGAFGQNLLNSYNQHTASQPAYSPSSASSGWQPRPTQASNDHRHSASVLQHAAQGSSDAQTAVFNALTEGSSPTSYKGGCPGCD